MKTRNTKLGVIAITLLSAAMPFTAKAQDKVKASVGADIVSGYIWRGQDLGGVSLQPTHPSPIKVCLWKHGDR